MNTFDLAFQAQVALSWRSARDGRWRQLCLKMAERFPKMTETQLIEQLDLLIMSGRFKHGR